MHVENLINNVKLGLQSKDDGKPDKDLEKFK